ncbi:MAG: type II toxin-antitoxin system VapC family toxin [Candidatus Rokubacteria bacterium]|nr:type II toxin-antitoxin system VapC family toxin [Candidatus Rokubacteria bacterium]
MIGLDTNVLVRYLTQDEPAQTRRANRLIGETVAAGDRCAIASIVMCELVWVLDSAYRLERDAIASVLERLLATADFVVEEPDLVRRALADYRRGHGDFADYLIGWRNRHTGCDATATFDRALRGSDLFRVL